MKREFNYDYNNSIMAIHAKVELEIVDMFKENGVNKIHLDELEPIYEDIVDEFWEKRIFHELYEKHERLLEEDCYELAETL